MPPPPNPEPGDSGTRPTPGSDDPTLNPPAAQQLRRFHGTVRVDYRDKTHLAYMTDVYQHPNITNYFRSRGVKVSGELFALSEMLQWLWWRERDPRQTFSTRNILILL